MKKILAGLILLIFLIIFFASHHSVFAQTPSPNPQAAPDGKWVPDQEVTFVGKTATRADDFLNWTLENYDWLCIKKEANNSCNNTGNPLIGFWQTVSIISYALLLAFILVSAFIIIITRGQNLTIMRFAPRFIFIFLLVVISYYLVQDIYVFADILQGFFLKVNGNFISSADLLHIDFHYNNFLGFRRVGAEFEESAFISLLLVRLTAFTYYAMTGILIIRKIILWFFIIVSSIFPLLLFYAPIRNTAKIWIGEFFRWLLYGPLFALFLHGLVVMWQKGIPLPFAQIDQGIQNQGCTSDAAFSCYPTAVNILLGGPGQIIGINNSVNLRDTFALYVVALLMLWVVTLLPFLLLNIFLDYINTISFREKGASMMQFLSRNMPFLGRPPSPTGPSLPPAAPAPAGVARALPFMRRGTGATRTIQTEKTFETTREVQDLSNIRAISDVMRLTNLSIPKMRDIARYESSMISRDTTRAKEVSQMSSTLQKIANPALAASPVERQQFSELRKTLVAEKQKGDPLATSIVSASQASHVSTSTIPQLEQQRQVLETQITKTTDQAAREKLSTQLATVNKEIASESTKLQTETGIVGTKVQEFAKVGTAPSLPVVNRVQQVSLEDYEEVKKMWQENYQNLDVPKGLNGEVVDRKTWIKNDSERINQAVSLLTSIDPQKVQQGMNMVANILPFLLIGGFSKTEVIAYLKAKLEAGKAVLSEVAKKQEEEETLIDTKETHAEEKKHMTMEEASEEKKPKLEDSIPDIDEKKRAA